MVVGGKYYVAYIIDTIDTTGLNTEQQSFAAQQMFKPIQYHSTNIGHI
jgi:hypothetical protein